MSKFKIGDKVRRICGGDPLVNGEVYTVSSLHYSWLGVEEFDDPHDDTPFEVMNFELVESVPVEQPLCTVYTCPIAEWLMKLGYVVATEQTVAGVDVNLKSKEVFICTDFGDITGVREVIDYVNTNYKMLKISENSKRKAELEAKRLKVLQELSDINQELNRYGE